MPFATAFVRVGFRVTGYDVGQRVIDLLMDGHSHIQDVASQQVKAAVADDSFVATTVESRTGECDTISVAVRTPFSKTRHPEMAFVQLPP